MLDLLPAANEVVGQGNIFLHLSCPFCFTGGGVFCLNACWDTNPPWTRPPPPGSRHPPPGADPPDQAPPPEQTYTPPSRHHPPRSRHFPPGADVPRNRHHHPPPGKQTPAYGLRVAGTHPTGMHSCLMIHLLLIL